MIITQDKSPFAQFWDKYRDSTGYLLPGYNYDVINRQQIKIAENNLVDCKEKVGMEYDPILICKCGNEYQTSDKTFFTEITDYQCVLFHQCPKCKKYNSYIR